MQNCSSVDETLHTRLGLETPALVSQLLPQLVDLVRASHQLPVGEEHSIRRSSRDFSQATKELGVRTLSAAHRVLKFLDPATHGDESTEELANYSAFADSIDNILERVDGCLQDALNGSSSNRDGGGGGGPAAAEPRHAGASAAAAADRGPPKPQVRWRQLVDNERSLFVPRLLEKHNAKAPLQPEIVAAQRRAGWRTADADAPAPASGRKPAVVGFDAELPHPYAAELQEHCWTMAGFETVMAKRYERMEDTPLVVVTSEEQLREMIDEIKATCIGGEIAVDVEHHEYRSYRGFVCLVQISTRQKDFIVDPFDIFPQMHQLNEIFTDPSIVKVLHGSDRDVIWLQRDFSVYLVNMFDTGAATRVLKLQGGFSLANLVSFYCGMKLDKKYQTADWRQRPMPDEMVQYARCDTHFLLYCYDRLKNALLSTGGGAAAAAEGEVAPEATADGIQALQAVLERSTELCRQIYREAPFEQADAARRLCDRFGSKHRPLEARNFAALKALTTWRDKLSRSLDESCNYMAPDACLWRIAIALPATPARLRSTCNPLPAALLEHSQELVDLVGRAADADAGQPSGAATAPAASAPAPARAGDARPAAAPRGGDQGVPEPPASSPAALAVVEPPALPELKEWPVRRRGVAEPVVHVAVAVDAAGSAGLLRRPDAAAAASLLAVLPLAESSEEEDEGSGMVVVGTSSAAGSSGRKQLRGIAGAMTFTAAPPEKSAVVGEVQVQPADGPSSSLLAALDAAPAAAAAPEEPVEPQVRRKKKRKRNAEGRSCLEKVVKAAVSEQAAAAIAAAEAAASAALESRPQVYSKPARKKRRAAKGAETPQAASDPYL